MMAIHKLIIAGFGGQGVMFMGQLIAYAAMMEGLHVTFLPSYGPEMRGGTANCSVIVSDKVIGSPVIGKADAVAVMNLPSLLKFEPVVVPSGTLFLNSSLIDKEPERSDIEIIKVNANDIAMRLENSKTANMVMLGAIIEKTGIVREESILAAMNKLLKGSKAGFVPLNRQALEEGALIVKK